MCNFINMHYDNYIISRWKQCNYFTQMIAIATLSSNMSIIHYSLLYYVINECKQCTTASIQKNLHGNYEMSCGRCKNSSAILHQYKTHRWQRCYYSFLLSQLWIQYLLFIIFSSIVYSILLSHIFYLGTQYYWLTLSLIDASVIILLNILVYFLFYGQFAASITTSLFSIFIGQLINWKSIYFINYSIYLQQMIINSPNKHFKKRKSALVWEVIISNPVIIWWLNTDICGNFSYIWYLIFLHGQ